jgi:hypothetical protein
VIAYELKQQAMFKDIDIASFISKIDDVYLAFSLKSEHKETWAQAEISGFNRST